MGFAANLNATGRPERSLEDSLEGAKCLEDSLALEGEPFLGSEGGEKNQHSSIREAPPLQKAKIASRRFSRAH